jgi:purine-nucleoside phosphorylase
MTSDELVYPKKRKNDPNLGPVAAMVAMQQDLDLFRRSFGSLGKATGRILTSKVYQMGLPRHNVAVVGPMLGAPYAVMVMEKLIALGVKKILFLGWCGSLQEEVQIADLVVPDRALIGEGTSRYYPVDEAFPGPSGDVLEGIRAALSKGPISFHQGPVWSTDAPFRETRQLVTSLQGQGVLGVDMEVSALFSAASFRHAEIGALLVVSDELASLEWKPGFSTSKFKRARKVAAEIVCQTCKDLGG